MDASANVSKSEDMGSRRFPIHPSELEWSGLDEAVELKELLYEEDVVEVLEQALFCSSDHRCCHSRCCLFMVLTTATASLNPSFRYPWDLRASTRAAAVGIFSAGTIRTGHSVSGERNKKRWWEERWVSFQVEIIVARIMDMVLLWVEVKKLVNGGDGTQCESELVREWWKEGKKGRMKEYKKWTGNK